MNFHCVLRNLMWNFLQHSIFNHIFDRILQHKFTKLYWFSASYFEHPIQCHCFWISIWIIESVQVRFFDFVLIFLKSCITFGIKYWVFCHAFNFFGCFRWIFWMWGNISEKKLSKNFVKTLWHICSRRAMISSTNLFWIMHPTT